MPVGPTAIFPRKAVSIPASAAEKALEDCSIWEEILMSVIVRDISERPIVNHTTVINTKIKTIWP